MSNSNVQTICKFSKATATRYLRELEEVWIEKIGTTGVGTMYIMKIKDLKEIQRNYFLALR